MKTTEIRETNSEELALKRRELKREMFELRLQQQSGQLESPARIRTVRRTLARIETILAERYAASE